MVHVSFEERENLWNWPGSNMAVAFVGIVAVARLPRRNTIGFIMLLNAENHATFTVTDKTGGIVCHFITIDVKYFR